MKFQTNREKLSVNSCIFSVNGFILSSKTEKVTFLLFADFQLCQVIIVFAFHYFFAGQSNFSTNF
jgi:hypothetical protein